MSISDNSKGIQILPLTEDNVKDVLCCPGGLETKGKDFKGDIHRTVEWRKKMLDNGMSGFIFYKGETPYGFIEYIPAESSPFPVKAPGSAVIMCFHWASEEEKDHLETELEMIEMVIEDIYETFEGIVTFGWDSPVHFPIEMLEELGFEVVESKDEISMMWLPLNDSSIEPSLIETELDTEDHSSAGKLNIISTYSHRCPYSIHNGEKVKETISEIDDDRIEFSQHVIDDQEDAIRWAKNPGHWEYLMINGEEINIFDKSSDEIRDIIEEKLSELEVTQNES